MMERTFMRYPRIVGGGLLALLLGQVSWAQATTKVTQASGTAYVSRLTDEDIHEFIALINHINCGNKTACDGQSTDIIEGRKDMYWISVDLKNNNVRIAGINNSKKDESNQILLGKDAILYVFSGDCKHPGGTDQEVDEYCKDAAAKEVKKYFDFGKIEPKEVKFIYNQSSANGGGRIVTIYKIVDKSDTANSGVSIKTGAQVSGTTKDPESLYKIFRHSLDMYKPQPVAAKKTTKK